LVRDAASLEAKIVSRSMLALFVAALAPCAGWAQIRIGGEFEVSTHPTRYPSRPSVASAHDGSFAVVWTGDVTYGGYFSSRVFGRRYDSKMRPSPAQVLSPATTWARAPAIAAAGEGYVVAWQTQDAGYDPGIFARRFDASLAALDAEFAVNVGVSEHQLYPSVACTTAGTFVVAWWRADFPDGDDGFVRLFDAAGTAVGGDLQIAPDATGRQDVPSVAMDDEGNFVVVWASDAQDGDGLGVFGQRFDGGGTPRGAPFMVNTYTTSHQYQAKVASDRQGNFVVVWASHGADGHGWGVFGRRYDAGGVPAGLPFLVNTYTTGEETSPHVAMAPDGRFVVVWYGNGGPEAGGIAGRMFDASGAAVGDEFAISAQTSGDSRAPVVAIDPSGHFVVVWPTRWLTRSGYGVLGQRFATDLIFRDGFADGSLGRWSSAHTDGGDLDISPAAGLNSTAQGLHAVVNDTRGLFVQDDAPLGEHRYRARFYFDSNGFDPGEVQNRSRTRMFIAFAEAPARRLAAVVLRRVAGVYSVMARARLDDNSQANTPFIPISDGPHFVEIDWRQSSAPDALDGTLEVWIDGVSVATLTGLDNSLGSVDFARLGALSVKAGANGTLYFDEFESRRATYIGP
jgi:hypothetical protein